VRARSHQPSALLFTRHPHRRAESGQNQGHFVTKLRVRTYGFCRLFGPSPHGTGLRCHDGAPLSLAIALSARGGGRCCFGVKRHAAKRADCPDGRPGLGRHGVQLWPAGAHALLDAPERAQALSVAGERAAAVHPPPAAARPAHRSACRSQGSVAYSQRNTTACPRTPHIDALATGPHSVLFHRFYSGAGVCSPTRASVLTGRNNKRSCIDSALPCDHMATEADGCSQGPGLAKTEFTVAKAAAKVGMATMHLGKVRVRKSRCCAAASLSPPLLSTDTRLRHAVAHGRSVREESRQVPRSL
jgi:hypothetical protein